ncbi:putative plasmalogen synthase [Lupinus albus]|uniref:Putative plasmalogen synthase n=1 Tax=Lupinus albus TaxID=3870 RepID=A0A6A4QNQ5_LUPAL|nr:putative plasmalogen synthase [Lupinus albus]
MADHDVTTPLLNSSDHFIITVDSTSSTNNHSPKPNPFAFIGCSSVPISPEPMTVDPFRNNTPRVEGVYEWVKVVVSLPLVVVRLVLFVLCLAVGFVATKIALGGWKDKRNPMPKWRAWVMWVTRMCARVILFAFGYHWIKRRGRPAPREIAPIIVSNHVSYIEPIFYFYELFATIVASESHDSLPFVGTIVRAMQVIYVDRSSPSSRKQVVQEIKRRASYDKFPRVLLFPEGTTTNGRNLISFQLGAFIAGYPIQPVIVRYPHVHFDQSWGSVSLAMLMIRMFTQFHNFFEVEYLPVIYPLDDKETAVHFRERTARAIATAINGVQTGHSYGDVMLYMKAQEAKKENPSSYMVEMATVESLFHIRSLEVVEFVDKFLAMNPDPSGRVQYDDFLKVLRLQDCPLSEKVFAFIDMENRGTITFRQFLYASAHVMTQPEFHQACEVAFAGHGGAVKAYIDEQEFQDFIRHAIPSWKEDGVHELFELFDNDNDGRINKDDFLSCLRRNPLLIALFSSHLQHKECGCNGVIEIV